MLLTKCVAKPRDRSGRGSEDEGLSSLFHFILSQNLEIDEGVTFLFSLCIVGKPRDRNGRGNEGEGYFVPSSLYIVAKARDR